jgi:eukaryotic-like serine/threonine-protein kinase
MALATGSLLAGRYEIVSAIATGGMGEVWRARDRVLDRIVAAKVLRSEYTGDPSFLARFRNEARHTAALTHPNIASVYDYGETTDETGTQQLAFLVMEYVEGQPLVSILHDEGRLPVDWTLHVLHQSAEGLSAAHRGGVVHRDIKPGNLLIRPDGVVKLTDFGIAQARDATPLTKTGMVVGTAQYLSPEQAQGMEVTAASDVYSLGVVAYECLAGARPFDGASQVAIALAHINRPPPPLPADVPPAVRLLVERALAKDPADRFADGAAFAAALHRVASGGTLTGARTPAVPFAPATTPSRALAADDSSTQVLPATGPRTAAGAGSPATGALAAGRPMPPLHARDDDAYASGHGPYDHDDLPPADRNRNRKWLWIALAVLLALLLGLGAWLLLRGDGEQGTQTPRTSASAGTSVAAEAFAFDPQAYIGRDYDAVQAELEAEGLSVTAEPATADQLAAAGRAFDADAVAATDPGTAGPLAPGADVVLYYAEQAYAPDTGEDTEAPASTSEAPPSTSEAPASSSAAPTSTSAASTSASATTSASSSSSSAPPATSSSAAASSAPESSVSSEPPPPAEPPVAEGAGQPDGDPE